MIRKLGDLKKWAPFLKGNIKFLATFVQILENLLKIKSQFDPTSLRETPASLASLTYTLEYTYLGLPRHIKQHLREIRIVAHVLWLQLIASMLPWSGLRR
jgi:hypothetical protein